MQQTPEIDDIRTRYVKEICFSDDILFHVMHDCVYVYQNYYKYRV